MKTTLLKTAIAAALITFSTHLHAFTAVTSGAWSSATTWGGVGPGSAVSNQDIIIPSGITVDMDVDVSFSALLNNFTVDGTLNSTASHNLSITTGTLSGSGTIDIHRLSFSGVLTTATFAGTMNLNSLQDQGSALTMAALVNISDTLDLDGGSIVLNTGSNLTMMANSHVRVNNGSLTSGGGLFTTGNSYDVWYVGTTKTTGLEINSTTLHHIHVVMNDNNQVVTQGMNNVVVNGVLDLVTGQYNLNGNHCTVMGNFQSAAGTMIQSTSTSRLTIMGSGSLTNDLVFTSGSTIDELTIDRSNGSVGIASALGVAGTLFLLNGDLDVNNGGTLTMNAGSVIHVEDGNLMQNGGSFIGTASYDVEFAGGSHDADVELSGSGLNNVSLNLSSSNDTIEMQNDVDIAGNLDLSMGMLSLYGNDLTLNGTFSQETTAMMMGDSTSDLTLNLTAGNDTIWFASGNGGHLRKLVLNIPAASTLTLGSDLTVHNQVDMTAGMIDISNYDLTIKASGSINNYSNNRYIITSGSGTLAMNVNSNAAYVVFPVGTMTNYSPAQVQQTSSGNSGMFMVRAWDGVYSNGTSGFNSATTESVVNQSWDISAAGPVNVNANIKLGWVAADEVNGFNRNMAYIAHYHNSAWDSYLAGMATTGANGTYEITRTGITSLSPFAVVDTSAVLGVNEQPVVAAMNVYPNPTIDNVTIEVSATGQALLYEVFDLTGKTVYTFQNSDTKNQVNLSGRPSGTYFIKITNVETKAFVTKRIVKS